MDGAAAGTKTRPQTMRGGSGYDRWIAVDSRGGCHGVVTQCRREEDARRIVTGFFPELELRLTPWVHASAAEKSRAMAAPFLTPAGCRRLGIPAPPPPGPSVHDSVRRLRRHFRRVQ